MYIMLTKSNKKVHLVASDIFDIISFQILQLHCGAKSTRTIAYAC